MAGRAHPLTAGQRGPPPAGSADDHLPRKHGANQISAGQISYDLRRLRTDGLIARVPHDHRYRITNTGLHRTMLITHIDTRLLQPGLAQLAGLAPPRPTVLRTETRNYQQALERLTQEIRLAA